MLYCVVSYCVALHVAVACGTASQRFFGDYSAMYHCGMGLTVLHCVELYRSVL